MTAAEPPLEVPRLADPAELGYSARMAARLEDPSLEEQDPAAFERAVEAKLRILHILDSPIEAASDQG